MRILIFDFETYSACDLKRSGAWRYGEDPTTAIVCLSWCLDDGPVQLWLPGQPIDELASLASASDVMWVAHNTAFEKAIWKNLMVPAYGFPPIPEDHWHDTLAVCAYKGIPLKLERAASALGLANQKDTEGSRLTIGLSRTNRSGMYQHEPERLARVYDYCKKDAEAERELHKAVGWLSKTEREVWKLDQTINQRGVRLDLQFIEAAQSICDQRAKPLLAEFQKLTGIAKVGSPKFLAWLHARGAAIPNLQKDTITKFLGDEDEEAEESLAGDDEDYQHTEEQVDLPFAYRRPLEIRKILGSASIKKLASMQACVCSDGRAHGLLQYHGAGPGRWAGRLLQPQNFPRPTLKVATGWDKNGNEVYGGHDPDQLVEAILTRDADYVQMIFGEPIAAIASSLRHALVPAHGHLFEVGDFAKIECVIVLAMAGAAETAAKVIKEGSKIYLDAATKLYKRAITKADLQEYTVGKANILACGFQLGGKGFRTKFAPWETLENCTTAVKWYREDFAPEVPKLWRGLEDAAVRTVWDRTPHKSYGIAYALEGRWLTARLHDGKKLWYFDPRPVRKHMPWCTCDDCCEKKKLPPETPREPDIRRGFVYSAWKMGQWKRMSAYGGLLTENVVQATARQLLVNGMFNCEREGHPLVLTVHDEVITEVPEALADAKLLDEMMTDVPPWAKQMGIPVASECWVGDRYRK